MTAFAISAPLEREDALAELAVRHGHRVALRAGSASELVSRLEAASVDAVLVAPGDRHLDAALVEACDRAGARVIAVVDDRAEAARARALGVEAVRFADGFQAIEWATVNTDRMRPSARRGTVLTVWGPAGAPGRTTVAIALAGELAALGQRVALIDADTHAAANAPALGLLDEAPGIAAAARLVRTHSLTTDELARVASTSSSSLGDVQVLTGLVRSARWPELAPDRVAGVLDACRDWVDWVVVDVASPLETDEEISLDAVAPRRNGATIAALREADRVLAVGAGDTVGMTRFLHAYPELLEIVPAERVDVVMNKVRASAMGVAPESSLDQTLARLGGVVAGHHIPFDPGAADAAMLQGVPIGDVAPRSRMRRRLRDLASALLPAAPTRAARRRAQQAARSRSAVALH